MGPILRSYTFNNETTPLKRPRRSFKQCDNECHSFKEAVEEQCQQYVGISDEK